MRLLSKEIVESGDEFHDLNVYPNNTYVLESGVPVSNTGFSFSKLRAANSMVKSSGGIASGPVSFMQCFDSVTETIKQGGRRRGANLGCIRDSHPDVFEFANAKRDTTKFPNFNISICISDRFMDSLRHDHDHWLFDYADNGNRRVIDATDLFDTICTNIWTTGEPGVIFIDRINAVNPVPWLGRVEATNPCVIGSTKIETVFGQIPIKDLVGARIPVYCHDGSFVCRSWMGNIRRTEEGAEVWALQIQEGNWVYATPDHKFIMRDGTEKCLRDLNAGDYLMTYHKEFAKVVSVGKYGYEDVYNGTVENYHNYAISQGIVIKNCGEQPLLPYESCNLGSIDLAKFVKKDGFWDLERLERVICIAVRFLDSIIDINEYPKAKIANKTMLTRKIGLGVMGWAVALHKRGVRYDSEEGIMEAEDMMRFVQEKSYEASFKIGMEKGQFPGSRGCRMRNACVNTIAPTGALSLLAGTSSSIEPVFDRSIEKTLHDGDKMYFSFDKDIPIATEIAAEWHVRMQAAFQKYVDNAVSKTINLPESSTVEDVKRAMLLSYESGCKGLTMYRQGTRDAPLKSVDKDVVLECTNGRCKL